MYWIIHNSFFLFAKTKPTSKNDTPLYVYMQRETCFKLILDNYIYIHNSYLQDIWNKSHLGVTGI